MRFLKYLFVADPRNHQGVRPVKIYLLRVLYFLIGAMMATDAWSTILKHEGDWEPYRAMALCVWAAYGTLSVIGIFKPLRLLPIALFMIFYKTLWLIVVSLPLWRTGRLAGSSAEELTYIYIAAPFMLLIIPWRFVAKTYFMPEQPARTNWF